MSPHARTAAGTLFARVTSVCRPASSDTNASVSVASPSALRAWSTRLGAIVTATTARPHVKAERHHQQSRAFGNWAWIEDARAIPAASIASDQTLAVHARPGQGGLLLARACAEMAYGPVRTPSTQQRPENFLDDLSNSGPAIRLCDEGRATGARPKTANNWRRSRLT